MLKDDFANSTAVRVAHWYKRTTAIREYTELLVYFAPLIQCYASHPYLNDCRNLTAKVHNLQTHFH